MYINEFLKQKRKEKGLSQKWIAEQIGLKPPAVCSFEKGRIKWNYDQVSSYLELLGYEFKIMVKL